MGRHKWLLDVPHGAQLEVAVPEGYRLELRRVDESDFEPSYLDRIVDRFYDYDYSSVTDAFYDFPALRVLFHFILLGLANFCLKSLGHDNRRTFPAALMFPVFGELFFAVTAQLEKEETGLNDYLQLVMLYMAFIGLLVSSAVLQIQFYIRQEDQKKKAKWKKGQWNNKTKNAQVRIQEAKEDTRAKDNNKSCSGRGKKKKKKNNNCSRNKKSNQQCGPNSQNAWNQKEVKKTQEPRSAAESSTSGTADQINKEERVLLEKGMEKRKQIDEKHSPVGVVLKRVKDKTGSTNGTQKNRRFQVAQSYFQHKTDPSEALVVTSDVGWRRSYHRSQSTSLSDQSQVALTFPDQSHSSIRQFCSRNSPRLTCFTLMAKCPIVEE